MSGLSRIGVAALGAATTVVVARVLGPSGAGGYAIAQTILLLLTVAGTLGVEHGIAYFVSAGRWPAADAYSTSRLVAAVTGGLGAGLAILVRLLAPSAFGGLSLGATATAACALPFALAWLYFTYIAVATDHYEPYVLTPAAQASLNVILVVILGVLFGLIGAVGGFALGHLLTACGTELMARRMYARDGSVNPAARRMHLRRAVSFGVKGYAANALQLINYRLDLFILSAVAGAAAVGRYSVAIAVTSTLWLLPQALSEVLFPRVASLSSRGGEDTLAARDLVEEKSMRHVMVVVLVATAGLAAVLLFLVVPIYGARFRQAVTLGLILLPGVAVLGIANTMAATVVGRGHPGYLLAAALVTTPLTVALYVLLIPDLHATGAALASSISYLTSFVLTAAIYRHVTARPLLARLAPTSAELADYAALPAMVRRAWSAR